MAFIEKDHNLLDLVKPVEIKAKIAGFSEPYFKLFVATATNLTTIRSVGYGKKYGVYIGDIGWITLNQKNLRKVKVVGKMDMKISEMPLKLLQKDANYPGHPIVDHEGFIELLNKFSIQAYGYGNNSLKTTKRIYTLKTISDPLFCPLKKMESKKIGVSTYIFEGLMKKFVLKEYCPLKMMSNSGFILIEHNKKVYLVPPENKEDINQFIRKLAPKQTTQKSLMSISQKKELSEKQ